MELIRVGTFELYPTERRLCAGGQPVELGARAFDLLLVLVENPGRLVTKATLLERVWPRLVVDENNLPAQVASLRRVLGAGAIRTVPRFGYRLDLEVSTSPARQGSDTTGLPRAADKTRLSVPQIAWPARLGALVGRDEDLRAVEAAIERLPLVAIVGGAGIGKSRLAQEVLAREAEKAGRAVAWVPLESSEGIERVPYAIALALGLSLPDGQDGFTALGQALEQQSMLLVLDGVEHLGTPFAAALAALVSRSRGLCVLVTSQAPLGVTGETVIRLTGLPLPESDAGPADAARSAAVVLFALRATAADRRFELSEANTALVSEICRRLDGNPLALELAAARVPGLGLAPLLARLDDRFRLLKQAGRGADSRHGVLQAALDWSYGLLSPTEQRVFNRLGTFAGTFALDTAAQAVADASLDVSEAIDVIGRLVDRSLVTTLPTDPPRLRLLETARIYALNRLEAQGELEQSRARTTATLLRLLDTAYEEYWSVDEEVWLNQYAPELDNVRAALAWAMQHDRALGVALFGSAWPLFVETDLHAEGRAQYDQAVALLSDAIPRDRVGRFWEAIAAYESTRQCDRARFAAELAADMHAATGNVRAHYHSLTQLALNRRDDAAMARATLDTARRLEDPTWPPRLLAYGALTEAALLTAGGRHVEARAAYRRALGIALITSERQALAATVGVVELDIACDAIASALQLARPLAISLRHSGRRETRFELLVLLFTALLIAGEIDDARATGAELYELARRLDPSKLYTVLDAMACLACRERRHESAVHIAACADAAYEAHGQLRRGPAAERMRELVAKALKGGRKNTVAEGGREPLDETGACMLALGLRA
jgi:predicted ATPase/DNA-binding winged helix-turn-helix (wHTH) protein